jgi:hypothetical protein
VNILGNILIYGLIYFFVEFLMKEIYFVEMSLTKGLRYLKVCLNETRILCHIRHEFCVVQHDGCVVQHNMCTTYVQSMYLCRVT